MTIVLHDKKIVLLKTYKTGSTSLHHYFFKLFHNNISVDFTSLETGHDTYDELKTKIKKDFDDYKIIAIVRYPVSYMNSVYKQFIYEKEKQSISIKIIRLIDKISVKLAIIIFYYYYCKLFKEKTNIVNANFKLVGTYPYKKLYVINYDYFSNLSNFIPEFNIQEFNTYSCRKYSDRCKFDIPKFLRKKIIRDFNNEINLIQWCCYETLFKDNKEN